jgi:16S rRNA processing protein RimM
MLIAFDEYRTPEAAGELRNLWVSVTADDRPALDEDEYYHHQVLGLRVVEEDGTLLGTVTEILETGANDVYVIRPDLGPEIGPETGPERKPAIGRDLLLPATGRRSWM